MKHPQHRPRAKFRAKLNTTTGEILTAWNWSRRKFSAHLAQIDPIFSHWRDYRAEMVRYYETMEYAGQ